MTDQQPPVDPSGQHYWDGTRWIPTQQPHAQQAVQPRPFYRRPWAIALAAVILIPGLLLAGCTALFLGVAATSSPDSTIASAPTSTRPKPEPAVTQPEPAPVTTKLEPTTTSPPETTIPEPPGFRDGTHRVGDDIEPGQYRTTNAGNSCYWERLSGFSGELTDIIANDFGDGGVVEIAGSDAGFTSTGCGRWEKID